MATLTFLWGTEPQVTTGTKVFLWGTEPQYRIGDTPVPPIVSYIFEILIDNTVVYSCSDDIPQGDISINTEDYIGTHTLTFRLRGTT
jgi:hypothetical protein